jgi:hypothetical protein
MRQQGASPARIDSGLAGVRLVMTRCARALQPTNAGGRYLDTPQKPMAVR